MVDSINYGPLNVRHKYTFSDYKNSFKNVKFTFSRLAVQILFWLWLIRVVADIQTTQQKLIVTMVILTAITDAFVVRYFDRSEEKQKAWENFVITNGWKNTYPEGIAEDTIIPNGLKAGHSRMTNNVVEGTLDDVNFRLFEYSYSYGSGKNEQTYNFDIISYKLRARSPHIILKSKKRRNGISQFPAKASHLELEGGFSDKYILYIEHKSNIDALSVLTPDVMHAILDLGQAYDIEILGREIYFITDSSNKSPSQVRTLFENTWKILEQIDHQLAPVQSSLGTFVPSTAIKHSLFERWKNKVRASQGGSPGAAWNYILVVSLIIIGFILIGTMLIYSFMQADSGY